MPAVRLGKMVLFWCDHCNIPILISKVCPICKSTTRQVIHTPPGDIRPAFDFDIELIKNVIDNQFGKGCGDLFIPADGVLILNHAPDLDKLDEVIFNGEVQGALRYDLLTQRFKFLSRLSGALLFFRKASKGYVIVDDGAIQPIYSGSNALVPGIIEVSHGIARGDEVFVLSKDRNLLGVGVAYLSGSEMLNLDHGQAVKIRWHATGPSTKSPLKKVTHDEVPSHDFESQDLETGNDIKQRWLSIIEANKAELVKMVTDAKKFIQLTIQKYKLPVAVSFSGGKDSLAMLLLVLEAGIHPKLFFVDTGLEFPETIEHVKNISKKFGLELLSGAPANTFWDGLKYFGPPGKDYRWCCKTCKLGPTTKLIKDKFPNGVLMFIGQRRYESEQRSNKGMIWKNPWVPGQVGASPIQHWSALHIWLYLFNKDIEFNKLYDQGLERIGCWLCPASDMADFNLVSEHHPDYNKWMNYLQEFSKSQSYSSFWLNNGLWRWKKFPRGIKKLIEENDIKIKDQSEEPFGASASIPDGQLLDFESGRPLELHTANGYSDCKFGLSMEGVFNKKLDIVRVKNLANILGEVSFDKSEGYCTIEDLIDIFPEGAIVVKGSNPKEIKKRIKKLHAIVLRAMECIGCGICIGRCDNQALNLDKVNNLEKIKVDVELCTHCGNCLGPCPVVNFNAKESFEM